jgi:branched-subunit amino acid transport protein AzlD
MSSQQEAIFLILAMGAVILVTRAFSFLFFKEGSADSSIKKAFLSFVEKTVPPAAMTVLAFNAMGGFFRESSLEGLLALAAAVFTALLHLWRRNALISITGGTALYMMLLFCR